MGVTLESIQAARKRLGDAIYRTPLPYSLTLSRLCDAQIYCKCDHLQITGSFKERGARNKLLTLTPEQRRAGVVAVSAGNHALGLAYHGQLLEIPVTVVMPRSAPIVKVANCRSFGATVIQQGESYAQAKEAALSLSKEKSLVFIPGYDDLEIMAGQGTMGLEILEDLPDVDAVIVPVGGGGLIAGVALAIKSLAPKVRIIGVEAKNTPTVYESMRIGHATRVECRPTLADGLAVAETGKLCFEVIQKHVEQIVLVDEVQIATAVLRLMEMEKMVVEGSGATSLAAAMLRELNLSGKKVVLCLTGGNIDLSVISHIIERGLASDGRLCRVVAYVSDRPGGLAGFLNVIATSGASVKEVSHDRNFGPADVARVAVSCVMETRDPAHILEIQKTLRDAKISFKMESCVPGANDLAKSIP